MIIDSYKYVDLIPFETTIIGTQEWSKFNLDIDDAGAGILYPNNDILNVPDYGLLYTYTAAVRIAATIPGWRLPTEAELTTLRLFDTDMGGKCKSTGTTYWNTPNTGATNTYDFNGRGAGYYNVATLNYVSFKLNMFIWTSTDSPSPGNKVVGVLSYASSSFATSGANASGDATSLRLIKE